MVTVLQDGTRAYVANTNPTGVGSVSVVRLITFTVTKTILFDGLLNGDGSQNINHGVNCHPNFINSIAGTPTGKVYVTCADSNFMTVLETDTDTVRTIINLQGKAVPDAGIASSAVIGAARTVIRVAWPARVARR